MFVRVKGMGDFGRLATARAKSKQVDRTKTDWPAPLFHESRLANLILEGPDTPIAYIVSKPGETLDGRFPLVYAGTVCRVSGERSATRLCDFTEGYQVYNRVHKKPAQFEPAFFS